MNLSKVFFALSLFMCILFSSNNLHSITQEQLLEYAVRQNDAELLDVLMKYANTKDYPGNTKDYPILNKAMKAHDYFAVFLLVEYGVDINSRSDTPPYYNSPTSIENGKTVLEIAIASNETSLIEYFLLNKSDPTNPLKFYEDHTTPALQHYKISYFKTAVYDAILLDRLDALTLFGQYGVDLNKACYEMYNPWNNPLGIKYTKTPLQIAIELKKKNVVALLLSIGVDI